MKSAEIKELSNEELTERIEKEEDTLTRLKINHSISELDNPVVIKNSRRTVGRLKTEKRNRQLQNVEQS